MTLPVQRWPTAVQNVQVRLALQCVVSLLIACVVMWFLPFPKPYWLALTALIVTANSFGETAAKSLERIIGTILGLLAGTLLWMAVVRVPAVALAVVIGCVFALFYERTARYRTVLFWLSLLLSLLFHLADAPDTFYLARLADTLIGTAIAVVVTVVLLPVRTGDEVREQMATLLELAVGRLQWMASVLGAPGVHERGGDLAGVRDALDKLAGLTSAEGVEALLLRRPRAEVRQRIDAATQIARCLLYADQLMPMLSGTEPEVPDALRAVGAEIGRVASAVRTGTTPARVTAPEEMVRLRRAAAAAHRTDQITLDQFQAHLRLHEALAELLTATDRVAQSAPATSARHGFRKLSLASR